MFIPDWANNKQTKNICCAENLKLYLLIYFGLKETFHTLRFNVKDVSTTALQRNIFKAFARKK